MTETLPGFAALFPTLVEPFRPKPHTGPFEFRVTALRECPLPVERQLCDRPDVCAAYWREHIATEPRFNNEIESLVILLLNTRRRLKGHHVIACGTHDTILCHPMNVFRLACVYSAPAIVLMHNHPSGDPTPSQADIQVTREIANAGKVLKIELLDHVIIGKPGHRSLRELGYLYF